MNYFRRDEEIGGSGGCRGQGEDVVGFRTATKASFVDASGDLGHGRRRGNLAGAWLGGAHRRREAGPDRGRGGRGRNKGFRHGLGRGGRPRRAGKPRRQPRLQWEVLREGGERSGGPPGTRPRPAEREISTASSRDPSPVREQERRAAGRGRRSRPGPRPPPRPRHRQRPRRRS